MANVLKKTFISIFDFFRYRKSYSQDGEDIVLHSFFNNIKKYKGYFVDVGAHHPIRFSNTWFFYKKGWRGINIDPTPGCMKNFKFIRRRDINLEIGIGSNSSELKLYCFNEPALNTFDPELAKERSLAKPYYVTKEIQVPVKPLSLVLKTYLPDGQKIDFLTIDVEGLDIDVLESNNWDVYKPLFILIEDNNFDPNNVTLSKIYIFLYEKGYRIVSLLKRTSIYKLKENL